MESVAGHRASEVASIGLGLQHAQPQYAMVEIGWDLALARRTSTQCQLITEALCDEGGDPSYTTRRPTQLVQRVTSWMDNHSQPDTRPSTMHPEPASRHPSTEGGNPHFAADGSANAFPWTVVMGSDRSMSQTRIWAPSAPDLHSNNGTEPLSKCATPRPVQAKRRWADTPASTMPPNKSGSTNRD
jgi:hypothetical protein